MSLKVLFYKLFIHDFVRAKYPLALTNRLIDVFGDNLLIGYDIGCGFSDTANNSKKVGPKIREPYQPLS